MIAVAGGILVAILALLVLLGFALMLRSVFRVGWKLLGYVTPLGILVFIFVAYSVWRIIASGA